MIRLRSIYRAFRHFAVRDRRVEAVAQIDRGVSRAPEVGYGCRNSVNAALFVGCKNQNSQRNVDYSNAALVRNAIKPDEGRLRNIPYGLGHVGAGFGLVNHDGDYLGTADRGWVFKAGQWIELSKAELSARRIASLRAQLAQAEAEAA